MRQEQLWSLAGLGLCFFEGFVIALRIPSGYGGSMAH
jgi:hypothetical protein